MSLNLSTAYIMDGQHVLSQEHQAIAEDIAFKYQNLRLIWIPVAQREPGDTEVFAIVDTNTGQVIKSFNEISIRDAMKWLWENDSQRIDTYAKHMKEKEEAAALIRNTVKEQDDAKLDLAASVLSSKLHTYKHAGKTYTEGYRANAG